MEKFENENNDWFIKRVSINYTRCLIGPRMHFSSMLLLVGILVEGQSSWRSLVEGEIK